MLNPLGSHSGWSFGMSVVGRVLMVMGVVGLAGCQMESADADLPPVRLSAPVILASQNVGVQPNYVAARPPVAKAVAVKPLPATAHVAADPAAGIPAAWIPSVAANHWTWIIIHHSDSDYGSAAIIDKWHRDRGFDELGYHFVIGNGTNSGDGQIEVGPRWTKQKWGAHDNALDNRYNTNGIGICLVGNFNNTRPTVKQLHSLVRLVVYLMRKYDIPSDRVLGHGETKVTQCPGKFLDVAEIRAEASRIVAEENGSGRRQQYADQR